MIIVFIISDNENYQLEILNINPKLNKMNCLKLLLLKFLGNGRFSLLVFAFLLIGMTLYAQKTINGNIKDESKYNSLVSR